MFHLIEFLLDSIFDFTVVFSTALGATLGFLSAGLLASNKRHKLYTRGWNAGREFEAVRQLRQIHDNLKR
jgi:hypothetical protein